MKALINFLSMTLFVGSLLMATSCVTIKNYGLPDCKAIVEDFAKPLSTDTSEVMFYPSSQIESALMVLQISGEMRVLMMVLEGFATDENMESVGYIDRCKLGDGEKTARFQKFMYAAEGTKS